VDEDPYLWLEDIDGEQVLDWIDRHNKPTLMRLSGERFEQLRTEAIEVFDSDDRIPDVSRRGPYLYNYWIDGSHPRGLWRRTTLDDYRRDHPHWEVVLDLDALAAAEGENWVWSGPNVLAPEFTRALIGLTRGGGDAELVREFDMRTKQFVPDGFNLPES
jgi:prolyl oligopeptidase